MDEWTEAVDDSFRHFVRDLVPIVIVCALPVGRATFKHSEFTQRSVREKVPDVLDVADGA